MKRVKEINWLEAVTHMAGYTGWGEDGSNITEALRKRVPLCKGSGMVSMAGPRARLLLGPNHESSVTCGLRGHTLV